MSKLASSFATGFVFVMVASAMGACADTRVVLGDVVPEAGAPATFTDTEEDAGRDASVSQPLSYCPSSECPAPLLTCPTSTHLCDVNPLNDDQNCGACGNSCAGEKYLTVFAGTFSCVEGACKLSCAYPYADCDGIPDNGCETNLLSSGFCGACGVTCASPFVCKDQKCVDTCPPPLVQTECGCTDLKADDTNCGACGVRCLAQPPGFDPAPPNAYYGCSNGVCNKLKCKPPSPSATWADCDGDLYSLPSSSSNGCEVNTAKSTDHCAVCGNKCAPGQVCAARAESVAALVPPPECLCKAGESMCPASGGRVNCVDLENDSFNCGACAWTCPDTYPHATAVCREGSCGFTCDYGWADCNGVEADGCETNVNQDPANCGACGNLCEGAEGQACVAGKCLVKPCEGSGIVVQ